MTNIPNDFHYTKDHEWVHEVSDGLVRFGITDYAQDALGDIVFLTLPHVGETISAGAACGEIESTKSVSDIFAPVDGVIVHRNDKVETAPETVNKDPYGDGWIAEVEVSGGAMHAQEHLMSASEYEAYLTQS
ncbi:MAG: glycine cleavage system protein GcvH [Candidatus Nanopelagicales bacterium]